MDDTLLIERALEIARRKPRRPADLAPIESPAVSKARGAPGIAVVAIAVSLAAVTGAVALGVVALCISARALHSSAPGVSAGPSLPAATVPSVPRTSRATVRDPSNGRFTPYLTGGPQEREALWKELQRSAVRPRPRSGR